MPSPRYTRICAAVAAALLATAPALEAGDDAAVRALAARAGVSDTSPAGLLMALDQVPTRRGTAPKLSMSQRATLTSHLISEHRSETLSLLRRDPPSGISDSGRRDRLQLLGALGDAKDLPRLLALVLDHEKPALNEFQLSARTLFLRDPAATRAARGLVPAAAVDIQNALTRALAETQDPAALHALRPLLDTQTGATAEALRAIGTLASAGVPCDWTVTDRVAGHLDSEAEDIREAACVACGTTLASDTAGRLLELLDDESISVRRAAREALQAMSGMRFGHDPKRWRSWYARELDWYTEQWPEIRERLIHGTTPEVLATLGDLSTHRLHRRELVEPLVGLLDAGAPPIRSHSAATLGELGLTETIPQLISALDDEPAAACAHRSLQKLTGLDLPLDSGAWTRALALDS